VIGHEQEVGRTLAAQNQVLLAYVRRRLKTAGDAEDVAQEAIMRAPTAWLGWKPWPLVEATRTAALFGGLG
jgi:DNA-directed RNA polymerase specialized sigma24 family protein